MHEKDDVNSSAHDDPHVCARCADLGPTCCHVAPGNEEFCFPLSRSEWERIVEHCRDEGGFAEERNSRPFVDTMRRLFPLHDLEVEELFPPHGTHMRLASDEEGYCAFLTTEGCRLPRDVRPWFCLLFPFWVRGRMLTMFTASDCLVCRETKTLEESLVLIGTTAKEVRYIFGRLKLAWGFEPESDE